MMNFSCIWQRWLCSVVSSMSPGNLGFHHLLLSEVLSTLIIQRSEILCQLVVYIHLNLLLVFSFLFFNMYLSWSVEWYNVHLFSFIFTAYNKEIFKGKLEKLTSLFSEICDYSHGNLNLVIFFIGSKVWFQQEIVWNLEKVS